MVGLGLVKCWVWLVWLQGWDMWALFGLATRVRPVSSVWFWLQGCDLWAGGPGLQLGNWGAVSCLVVVKVYVLFLCNWTTCWAFLVIRLHVIISYTCWVLYVLILALFPVYCYYALLLKRWGILWCRLLLGVRNTRSSAYSKMVSFSLLSPFWTCNKFM
jgi:hypothetical protein